MGRNRGIKRLIRSKPTLEGAGVHLRRAFGSQAEATIFDPFLLLDDFRADRRDHYVNGFPWHPHRGIETITYVLRGDVEHGDSLGNNGIISSGDVQWMTAGSGIIHQEMPKGDDNEHMWGFQLWANLPAAQKMMEPRYRDVTHSQIPEIKLEKGVTVRIVAGAVDNTRGPVHDIVIEPEYLDVTIPPHVSFIHPTGPGHTVFAYVIEGRAFFCPEQDPFSHETAGANYFDLDPRPFADNHTLVLYENGEQITVTTEDSPVRFLLISGKPLREPVAWYGPIVMNTRDELRIAFEEYQNGTFIK